MLDEDAEPRKISTALETIHLLDETARPHSRNRYPGSARLNSPHRRKAFQARHLEHDAARGIWAEHGKFCSPMRLQGTLLPDARTSLFSPLSAHNLPVASLVGRDTSHFGVLVIGRKSAGKSALVRSLLAVAKGTYPESAQDGLENGNLQGSIYGMSYLVPEGRGVHLGGGLPRSKKVLLTDTPPMNIGGGGGAFPLSAAAVCGGGRLPHNSMIFVLDGSCTPLWEGGLGQEVAELLAIVHQRGYNLVLAVVRLQQGRRRAMERKFGFPHGGQGPIRRDPRRSYEAFVAQYLERICMTIQAAVGSTASGAAFAPNVNVFDVPTWLEESDWLECQTKRGGAELPNWVYTRSQLNRLLVAALADPESSASCTPPRYCTMPCCGAIGRTWSGPSGPP